VGGVLGLLAVELEAPARDIRWLDPILDDWALQAVGCFTGIF
jgi:hypothetical protein